MAEYTAELPEGVGVEVVTFIAYEDGRPTEMVMAGTADEDVSARTLNDEGQRLLASCMLAIEFAGIDR